MGPIVGGPAERRSDGPRGRLLDESRALARIYGSELADHGQMVRELRGSANRLTARVSGIICHPRGGFVIAVIMPI